LGEERLAAVTTSSSRIASRPSACLLPQHRAKPSSFHLKAYAAPRLLLLPFSESNKETFFCVLLNESEWRR
jgi:hypothetical protein